MRNIRGIKNIKWIWAFCAVFLLLLLGFALDGSGIATAAYNLIENNGSAVAMRPTLNFTNGGCVDNPTDNRTDCTISGGGSSASGGIVTYSGAALTPSGTIYFPIGGGGLSSATETNVDVESPAAATVANFYVQLSAAPGTGNSITFTWRDNASSTALRCTVTGATATSCNDTTDSFSAAQGDLLDIQAVTTGTILAALTNVMATQFGVASSGGGGFIQALTAPVAANFSQINFSGTGVTTTQVNGTSPVTFITLHQQDPTHTGNLAALSKAKIAATFTVTVALTYNADPGAGAIEGLWLNDTGQNALFFGTFQNGSSTYLPFIQATTQFNNAGSGSTNIYDSSQGGWFAGPVMWLRIQETASARNYYTSSDGVTFYLIYTESNTAHLTTANYGIGIYYFAGSGTTYDGGISWYSFTETNP